MKRRILVVEDEEAIREGLVDSLVFHGYGVSAAATGTEAESLAGRNRYDLVVLDIMLPGVDGFTLLESWRRSGMSAPVLVLTARGGEGDLLKGLKLGADDYMTKPFSIREFIARVGAILRRTMPDAPPSKAGFAGGTLDLDRLVFEKDGERHELTDLDLRLARYLLMNMGRVVTREELLERIWETRGDIETRKVDMAVSKLRRMIGDEEGEVIRTARGTGYIYEEPAKG